SKNIKVATMLEQSGDIHHIVPKNYLQKHGLNDRSAYNQVANFALTETSINIAISNKPPREYLEEVRDQIFSGILKLGEILGQSDLEANFAENAIPYNVAEVEVDSYQDFLKNRRR